MIIKHEFKKKKKLSTLVGLVSGLIIEGIVAYKYSGDLKTNWLGIGIFLLVGIIGALLGYIAGRLLSGKDEEKIEAEF